MNKQIPVMSLSGQCVSKNDIEAASRLVHTLERFAEQPCASNANSPTPQQLVKLAKRLRDLRKDRARFFDERLFGEPAWDMLLALYVSNVEGYRVKVTDLIHESLAPSSTALRWIERLHQLGFTNRRENPLDGRMIFVEMKTDGVRKVTAFLETAWIKYFPFE